MKAAGDYQENLRTTTNTDFDKVKQLFDISQKLTLTQSEEISGISTIDRNTISQMTNCIRCTTKPSSCRKQRYHRDHHDYQPFSFAIILAGKKKTW